MKKNNLHYYLHLYFPIFFSDIRIDAKRPTLPFYDRPIDFLVNNPRCSIRLENALEQIRRRQLVKEKTLNLKGYSLHKQLRTIPYDMYVTDMRVRLPTTSSWVCILIFITFL